MTAKIKKGNCAIWGAHMDEVGIITRVTADGFYARYKSRFPKQNRRGHMEAVYKSRLFKKSSVVECVGFPPNGSVKVCRG